jgi:hypothetical protein
MAKGGPVVLQRIKKAVILAFSSDEDQDDPAAVARAAVAIATVNGFMAWRRPMGSGPDALRIRPGSAVNKEQSGTESLRRAFACHHVMVACGIRFDHQLRFQPHAAFPLSER